MMIMSLHDLLKKISVCIMEKLVNEHTSRPVHSWPLPQWEIWDRWESNDFEKALGTKLTETHYMISSMLSLSLPVPSEMAAIAVSLVWQAPNCNWQAWKEFSGVLGKDCMTPRHMQYNWWIVHREKELIHWWFQMTMKASTSWEDHLQGDKKDICCRLTRHWGLGFLIHGINNNNMWKN